MIGLLKNSQGVSFEIKCNYQKYYVKEPYAFKTKTNNKEPYQMLKLSSAVMLKKVFNLDVLILTFQHRIIKQTKKHTELTF